MSKSLLEMAAEIVQAQVSQTKVSPEEIEATLSRTFTMLQKMQKAEEEGKGMNGDQGGAIPSESPEIDPKTSIREHKIICLECGTEMKQLTSNHLANHGLTPKEYKKKYGFPLKQALSAKSLTRSRSKSAKKRGVPEELLRYQEEQRQKKQQTSSTSHS